MAGPVKVVYCPEGFGRPLKALRLRLVSLRPFCLQRPQLYLPHQLTS